MEDEHFAILLSDDVPEGAVLFMDADGMVFAEGGVAFLDRTPPQISAKAAMIAINPQDQDDVIEILKLEIDDALYPNMSTMVH